MLLGWQVKVRSNFFIFVSFTAGLRRKQVLRDVPHDLVHARAKHRDGGDCAVQAVVVSLVARHRHFEVPHHLVLGGRDMLP